MSIFASFCFPSGRQDETLRGVQLPAPIVTDLDGDGISEVVIVTRRGELQTLRVPIASEESTQRVSVGSINQQITNALFFCFGSCGSTWIHSRPESA